VEVTESGTRFIRIGPDWMPLAAVAIGLILGYLFTPKTVQVRVEKPGRG